MDAVQAQPRIQFTSCAGAYATQVAEHALALLLAVVRGIVGYAQTKTWDPGGDHVLEGSTVAIIGAGGIGFDVAELISHAGVSAAMDVDVFAAEWGIDFKNHPRGGVTGVRPKVATSDREITLLQRKETAVGKGLGRTTGWTHRLERFID
jgi:glutamate dehydrogenase/leucine dehydrogenase